VRMRSGGRRLLPVGLMERLRCRLCQGEFEKGSVNLGHGTYTEDVVRAVSNVVFENDKYCTSVQECGTYSVLGKLIAQV
jgi:hypothetical protein